MFLISKRLAVVLSVLCVQLLSEELAHFTLSVYAVQCSTGKVLRDQNSDLSLIPASCMKVVTTGAALHLLGEDLRFETALEYDGFIDSKNTLHGNLYIRGGGDPCLGSDRIFGGLSWKKQLEVWAGAVRKLGIVRIEGKVIGDASKWEKAQAVPSWCWEDLGNYYGAGASALSFHENSYSLFFKPGPSVGDDATIIRTEPPLLHHIFQNEVKTGPAGSGDRACIYGSEFSPIQFVRGTIPAAVNEFFIRGAIPDPATYAADLLTKELRTQGITIVEQDLASSKRVAFHTASSPTIKEIVHWTNQKSINLYAEHLLKKMGEVAHGDGSTASGVKAVTAFWNSQKIDLGGFNMDDGSGLSRKNLVTTKQLVNMLLTMKTSPHFHAFYDSLPLIEGSIRAKDGNMSLIKGYVGYRDNIAFAIIINQGSNSKLMKETMNLLLSNIQEVK